jgi:hypothetical protein
MTQTGGTRLLKLHDLFPDLCRVQRDPMISRLSVGTFYSPKALCIPMAACVTRIYARGGLIEHGQAGLH